MLLSVTRQNSGTRHSQRRFEFANSRHTISSAIIRRPVEDENDTAFTQIPGVGLCEIAPALYKPYVMMDKKGINKLLVQCQNAFISTIVATNLQSHRSYTLEWNAQ